MTHSVLAHKLTAAELLSLEDLVAHPGWHLFEIMADEEWGDKAFTAKLANTIGRKKSTLEEKELALAHLEQATVAREAVQGLMKWPRATLAAAKAAAQGQLASMNRGGL